MSDYKKGDTLIILSGVMVWRRMTDAEREAWYEDPYNKGIGEDGETKLCPRMTYMRLESPTQFLILSARVRAPGSWGSVPKCMTLLGADGHHYWVEKCDLR